MTRISLSGLALLASLAATSTAYAAIDPRAPMDDIVVPGDNISLTFTAPVKADRTTVKLSGPNGPVTVGEVYNGADPRELIVPVSGDLPSGVYTIQFNAYSVSGKQMTGSSSLVIPALEPSRAISEGSSEDAVWQLSGEAR